MIKLRTFLKYELFLIKLMFKIDVKISVFYWLIVCALQGIPLINVWLWKMVLDELSVIFSTKNSGYYIWSILGCYLALGMLLSIFSNVKEVLFECLHSKTIKNLDEQVMRKMSTIDTEFFDIPQNSDMLEAAEASEIFITYNMTWAVDILIRIITFVSGLIMFLSYDPILGWIYIATYIPGAIISYKYKVKLDQWSIENIPLNREKNYYKALLTQSFATKDLRLYNLADYFKSYYNDLWNKIRKERDILFQKGVVALFLASLLTYGGLIVIIILSVQSVMSGTMLIGTLALYIGLAKSSGENFQFIIEGLACHIEIDVPYVIRYIDFINYENTIKDEGTASISSCPTIEFRNVCFKYPNCEEYVIDNLSFKIARGKKVALIGINGAGKSTIIKLLLRFYEVESGEILIDGKDIHMYPLKELHRVFSVCFQDINTYALTFKENIVISDIEKIDDGEAVKEALVASGADKICDSLPFGVDTDMTRQFNEDGVELSRGQWQKIALTRAFFRKSDIIILDEPSSALDPEAEDYVFSSFKRLCKDKGGILISHRLSSIMMVDEIIFIDNGAVIENGTHAELIESNGKYAELYRMQAEKYVGGEADV